MSEFKQIAESRKQTEAGVKLFASIQLIYDNVKEAQYEGMSGKMKVRLNKLRFDCGELNKEFWDGLSPEEEMVFQDKLRRAEQIFEE